jgi:hypothetical protein
MAVDTALITQFSNLLHTKAQQMKTRLMGKCPIIPISGDHFAYDGTGLLEARTVNERNPLFAPVNPDFTRRKMTRERVVVELIVDNRDVRGMFEDPSSKLVDDCMFAIMRKADKIGITALHAAVLTGKSFGTSVSFATDGGQTVDATGGFTYLKLLDIIANFKKNDVGLDMPEEIYLGISEQEEKTLLNISQLTSGDFSREYAVEKGVISKAVGMNIILFGSNADTPQLPVASSTRDCFAMTPKGLTYGMSKQFSVKVIPDYPGYVESTYIQVLGELGAVRTDGERVQKIQTTAS